MDYIDEYEQSEIDNILEEFKQRCEEVLLEDVNTTIGKINSDNARLQTENAKLKKLLDASEKNGAKVAQAKDRYELINGMIDNAIVRLKQSSKEDLYKHVYDFLDIFFEKDFDEDEYDLYNCSLWLGALTQYYHNKDKVMEILKLFKVTLPDKIDLFRLPIDWNEDELDIFFSTVNRHSNCNGSVYSGNLRYWETNSLKSVYDQCHCCLGSDIPWQYVLRNPLLKNPKYLIQIGRNIDRYGSYWDNFYEIDKYLDLSDDEIKVILTNINNDAITSNNHAIYDFILRHIDLITDSKTLDQVYKSYNGKYDFEKAVLKMPYKYVLKYVKDNKQSTLSITKFIQDNKNAFDKNQLTELYRALLSDDE